MMAEVAEAKRATEIDGRLLIKGFSTLFVPTKRVDDLVMWHMLYNEDGGRISYFDLRGVDIGDASVKGLTFSALESSRHILGWCSVAKNLAGSRHAKYDIKASGLSQPGQGWTFEKVSISGGKIINGGVTFGKGNINNPLHIRRQPVYVKQIYEASCKHVIFYDVGDRRAWLVNGAAALLHLARAYLVFASKQPFLSTMTKFRLDDLWAPNDEYEASAPFKILCNSKNMDLVIYEDWKPANEAIIDAEGNLAKTAKVKDAHFRFRDQVDEIYHIWEQIQEFQTKMTDNIRLTDRDKLQGFNFMDVATGERNGDSSSDVVQRATVFRSFFLHPWGERLTLVRWRRKEP
ncbi:Pfs domain protein [Lasiodiplodia theobromae]|uniref:Pfs domain protein n=1 Tax=Lasiodiplodia theobromae TaxID=45133 RepID=UPI0015C35AA5|nr:Pfs domain protein [Lasiodiplodia theobromae]KAF4544369.1 Pfs domain protein [Lasiodiplodia theobromae]